ncbi:MAG: hypothetical protein Q8807_04110, partial ['Waltheria sp.' little leaf phytoplasma]|nr:hypothetical protein ['Waltheria sp.' little leaf phytoplasma]
YKNQTIANIYDMNVSEAYTFFHNHQKIKIALEFNNSAFPPRYRTGHLRSGRSRQTVRYR